MDDDSILNALRAEISSKSTTCRNIFSLNEISVKGSVLNPICDLIQASTTDEKLIPKYLSKLESKIADLKRGLDLGNLNTILAINLMQMFSDFVKFVKASPSTSINQSEMCAEIARLKSEIFKVEMDNEKLRLEQEKVRIGSEKIREILSSFDGDSDDDSKKVVAQRRPRDVRVAPKPKKMPNSTIPPKGKRNTQMIRTVTTRDRTVIPLSNDGRTSSPSMLPSPSAPIDPSSNFDLLSTLKTILGDDFHSTEDETEDKTDTKRRRRAESPIRNEESEVEIKKICRKMTNQGESHPNGGGDTTYMCPFDECSRSFNKICTMFDHTMSDHYWIGALQLQCSVCSDAFENERTFENHQVSCLTGEIVAIVRKWDHKETREERVKRIGLEKKLMACPFDGCDFTSKNKTRSINKHVSRCHEGQVWYKCSCGLMRKTLSNILFHHYLECHEGDIEWIVEPNESERVDEIDY